MQIIKRLNHHLHGPDMQKIPVWKLKQDSKENLCKLRILRIILLAKDFLNSLKRTIQPERTEGNSVSVQPGSLIELDILLDYPRNANSGSFLLYDSGYIITV